MKKKFISLSICCCLFLLSGCKTDITENNATIYVDIAKNREVSLWDIFSNIELIPLETNEFSLIRNIMKMIEYNSNYYILDYNNAEILVFGAHGKFLHKISDKGAGPQEYINIGDFNIDLSNSRISLLSAVNNSMYEYDLNGNFVRKYTLPQITGAYKSFFFLNTDTTVYFTFDADNKIKLYSKSKDEIIKELFPEEESILNKFSHYEFPYQNYLFRSSSNTIFLIKSTGDIVDGYTWDLGKLNNTKKQIKYLKKIPYDEFREYFYRLIDSEIINHIPILHGGNSKYLFTQIWRKGKHINIFHDKEDDINYVFEKTIENATFHPLLWKEEYVIGYYSSEWGEVDETIPDAILDNKNIEIKKALNEDDNPILIKYHFKK